MNSNKYMVKTITNRVMHISAQRIVYILLKQPPERAEIAQKYNLAVKLKGNGSKLLFCLVQHLSC